MTSRPFLIVLLASLALAPPASTATSPQELPFAYAWSDTSAIAADDDWSGVAGTIGYRGDDLVRVEAADPQTVSADGAATPVDVVANRTNPASVFAGGIAEFELTDPVVSLRGSVTADAPHLVVALDTSGYAAIRVSYLLRDLDATSANAVQPFALQYRVGGTADYANVPAAFVGDATDGPARASRVTAVEATLPPKAADRPLIEVRILTANAAGADEWVGIDEIAVAGTAVAPRDTTPPALSLVAASRQPLRRSLRKGVRVGATIGEATTLEVAARISRWLAARLALPRVVGTASVAAAEGRTRLRLRFHAPARRKLSRRTRVRLTLVARASDRAGNASRARAATVLVRQRARR